MHRVRAGAVTQSRSCAPSGGTAHKLTGPDRAVSALWTAQDHAGCETGEAAWTGLTGPEYGSSETLTPVASLMRLNGNILL